MVNKLKQNLFNLSYIWHKRLFRHKCIEVEVYSGLIGFSNKVHMLICTREISFDLSILNAFFHLELNIRWKTDHAGISLWLGLLGFDIGLHFYDTRHWDFENNKWEE